MTSGASKAIIFLGAILIALEAVLYVKFSQFGLDDHLCKYPKSSEPSTGARVFNGVPVSPNDYKWAASVFVDRVEKEIRYIQHKCTASILSATYVLCAGHCLLFGDKDYRKKPLIDQLYVAAGAGHNMTSAYLSTEYRRKVKRLILHPEFERISTEIEERLKNGEMVTCYHDISLIELKEPFTLGDQILPGVLYERQQDDFMNELIITGFGDREMLKDITHTVIHGNRLVRIELSGNDLLMAKLRQTSYCSELIKDFDKSLVICARGNKSGGLFGDSGGPLHYVADEQIFIVGVASLATLDPAEKDAFSMFTKVERHLEWIDSYMGYQRCLPKGNGYRFNLFYFSVFLFISMLTLFALLTSLWILKGKRTFLSSVGASGPLSAPSGGVSGPPSGASSPPPGGRSSKSSQSK